MEPTVTHYTPEQVQALINKHEREQVRHREVQIAYYERNAEARRQYHKEYYLLNKATVLEKRKEKRRQAKTIEPVL